MDDAYGVKGGQCLGHPDRERHGVRLERQHMAIRRDDLIFVGIPDPSLWHEDFPEAVAAHTHGVAAAIP